MGVIVGRTPIVRGVPPVERTLEVLVDSDWMRSAQLESCVTFREASQRDGKVTLIFSRSITAAEARAFADLLHAAAAMLDTTQDSPASPESASGSEPDQNI